MFGSIYKVTNLVNGRIYVGQTTSTLKSRWQKHLHAAKANKPWALARAIRKYGSANFSIELIVECADREALNKAEMYHIASFEAKGIKGYNLTDGGKGTNGYKMLAEQIEKIRASRANYKPTEATKSKISIAMLGRKLTTAHILAVKKSKTGAKLSAEAMARRSASMTGQKGTYSYPVVATNQHGVAIEFESISAGAKYFNILNSSISNCLKGRSKKAGGLSWNYLNKSAQ